MVNGVVKKSTRYHICGDNYLNDNLVRLIAKDVIIFLEAESESNIFNKPAEEKKIAVFINTRHDPLVKDKIDDVRLELTREIQSIEKRLLIEIKNIRLDIGQRVGVLEKYRWIILLISSYIFYSYWNIKYTLLN